MIKFYIPDGGYKRQSLQPSMQHSVRAGHNSLPSFLLCRIPSILAVILPAATFRSDGRAPGTRPALHLSLILMSPWRTRSPSTF
jgi:hypothetical protein